MQITLWRNKSQPNKIIKDLDQQNTLIGNFRGDYDERYPLIEVEAIGITQNYATIGDIKYFISDITYTTNRTALIRLSMDYISTYQSEINDTKFFVDRKSKINLMDKYDPMQYIPPTSISQIINMGDAGQDSLDSENQRRVLLIVAVKPNEDPQNYNPTSDEAVTRAAGHNSYLLTVKEAYEFAIAVYETSWKEAFLKFFGKPYDGVIAFIMLPFTPEPKGGVLENKAIRIGDQYAEKGGIAGDSVFGSQVIGYNAYGSLKSQTVYLPYDPKLGFINRPPYSKYEIHIPYYGFYTIDYEQFSKLNISGNRSEYGIFVEYAISLITGEATIHIGITGSTDRYYVDTLNVDLRSDLPFSSESYFGVFSKIAGMGAIAAAAFFTGGAASAAGAGTAATAATSAGTAKVVGDGLSGLENKGGGQAANTVRKMGSSVSQQIGESLMGNQYQYSGGGKASGGHYIPGLAHQLTKASKIYMIVTKPEILNSFRDHDEYIGTKYGFSNVNIVNDESGTFYMVTGATRNGNRSGIFGTRHYEEIMEILQGGIYV